jgi:hypothetical protein
MNVARQFIAWYRCENGNRPEGYGMIGSDGRATIFFPAQCWSIGALNSLLPNPNGVPSPKWFEAPKAPFVICHLSFVIPPGSFRRPGGRHSKPTP